ncbi:MAG: ATP-dependent 6-phosphofructokinase [Pseudomonadota bacterium]
MNELDFNVCKLGECSYDSSLEKTSFEDDASRVLYSTDPDEILKQQESGGEVLAFEKAGPRKKIFFYPERTKAAILTAGGLCPGLNDVIKGLTITLKIRYGVPVVYGIRYGYRGLISEYGHEPILITEDDVDALHEQGGTVLGSSRGQQDVNKMVDRLVEMNVNILFCVGGDGTLKGAHAIVKEIESRKLLISVVCIPKTIDNDICFIDKTFGFETAVYATDPVIVAAHNEARGAYNGIGLIHVMGRDSGFIAAYAALANSHINYCLVPEEEFTLNDGPNALLPSLQRRMEGRKHAVIIVAEGAGQNLFETRGENRDKSGNLLHQNIGLFLKEKIESWSKENKLGYSIKYFDPSYLIRSLPAHGTDAVFCLMLAQNAVHAAMAGRTNMVVGHWNDHFTDVPIALATSKRRKIDLTGPLWRSVKAVTWPK